MNKKYISLIGLLILLSTFSGCSRIGEKNASLTIVYIVTSVLALILLIGYCFLIKKREPWFLLLFSAVFVVNIGYLTLAISATLEEALLANRIAYLGSVFLPLSMFMIITNICKLRYKKWFPVLLLTISTFVFLIAASPGYLDIYYKEVSLVTVNGVTVLDKVYGPLHQIYLYYLIFYFTAMIGVIIFAKVTSKIKSTVHAMVILGSVLVNIGVWLMEQLVKFDFEFLSISYIVTELFLLSISLVIQDSNLRNPFSVNPAPIFNTQNATPNNETFAQQCEYLKANLYTLTPTEKAIYLFYLDGKGTKDIMDELNITENTLKYHNKNIYSKLGVSSRKQLLSIANALK